MPAKSKKMGDKLMFVSSVSCFWACVSTRTQLRGPAPGQKPSQRKTGTGPATPGAAANGGPSPLTAFETALSIEQHGRQCGSPGQFRTVSRHEQEDV